MAWCQSAVLGYIYIYILGGGFLESLPPYIYIFKMKKARLMFVSYCLQAQWCGGSSRARNCAYSFDTAIQFRYSFDTAIQCQNDKKRKSVTLS